MYISHHNWSGWSAKRGCARMSSAARDHTHAYICVYVCVYICIRVNTHAIRIYTHNTGPGRTGERGCATVRPAARDYIYVYMYTCIQCTYVHVCIYTLNMQIYWQYRARAVWRERLCDSAPGSTRKRCGLPSTDKYPLSLSVILFSQTPAEIFSPALCRSLTRSLSFFLSLSLSVLRSLLFPHLLSFLLSLARVHTCSLVASSPCPTRASPEAAAFALPLASMWARGGACKSKSRASSPPPSGVPQVLAFACGVGAAACTAGGSPEPVVGTCEVMSA